MYREKPKLTLCFYNLFAYGNTFKKVSQKGQGNKGILCPWEETKMSDEKKTEKKMSELDKRISARLGNVEERKQITCLVDGEKFVKVSDMMKWLHRVHRMSSTQYIELLIRELDRANRKIAELEQKGV
jgi:hypothetical protein